MTKNEHAAIVKHCDNLTKNGKQLSITWNGGNDSGCYEMVLDGEPRCNLLNIENFIMDMVATYVGYESFAGDFSTSGELIYNRENKSFEGVDEYTEDSNDRHSCSIPIRVPKELWFDQLELLIDIQNGSSGYAEAHFIIKNGPYDSVHSDCENKIKQNFSRLICAEIEKIKEFSSMSEEWKINSQDFTKNGKSQVFILESFEYSFWKGYSKQINFSLSEQIDHNEIL